MAQATALVKILGDVDGFSKSLTKVESEVNRFGKTMTVTGARMTAGLTLPLVAMGTAIFKYGTQFQTAMAKVKKTVGTGNADLKLLETTMRDLAEQTIFSATELSEFARLGAQLGVGSDGTIEQNTTDLIAFTQAISDLAVAANELPAEQAATGIAKLLNVTGEDISSNVSRVTNTLALLGDSLPTTEERILGFSVLLAGMADVAKLGTAEILGLAGGITSVVNGNERAASATMKLIGEMVSAIKGGGKELDEFSQILGISGEDMQAMFAEKGIAPLIEKFIGGLKNISKHGGNAFKVLQDIGLGNIKTQQTFLAAAGGLDNLTEAMRLATEDPRRLTKAMEEAAIMMQTVEARAGILWDALKRVFIDLFKAFEPQIQGFIANLTILAGWLSKLAVAFGTHAPEGFKLILLSLALIVAAGGPLLFGIGSLVTMLIGLAATTRIATAGLVDFIFMQKAATASMGTSSAASLLIPASNLKASTRLMAGLRKGILAVRTAALPLVTALGGIGQGILAVAISAPVLFAASAIAGGVTFAAAINTVRTALDETKDPFENAIANVSFFSQAWSVFKEGVSGTIEGFKNFGLGILEVAGLLGTDLVKSLKFAGQWLGIFSLEQNKTVDSAKEFAQIQANKDYTDNILKLAEGAKKANDAMSPLVNATDAENKSLADFVKIQDEKIESDKKAAKATIAAAKADEKKVAALAAKNAEIAKITKSFFDLTKAGKAAQLSLEAQALSSQLIDNLPLVNQIELHDRLLEVYELLGIKGQDVWSQLSGNIAEHEKGVKTLAKEMMKVATTMDLIQVAGPTTSEMADIMKDAGKMFPEDVTKTLENQFKTGALGIDIGGGGSGIDPKPIKESANALEDLGDALNSLSSISQIFKGTFGKVITEVGAFVSGMGSLKKIGGLGGIGGLFNELDEAGKSTGEGFDLFGGIARSIPVVASLIGPAISFGKALFGAFHKSQAEKIIESIGRDMGVTISEELAKSIESTMKAEGLGSFEASLLHLGDIISEGGGINTGNIDGFTASFNDLLNVIALGGVDAAKGLEEINEVFPQLVDGFEKMGFAGQLQIGNLVNRMKELGLESEAVSEHMKEMAAGIVENFTPMLDLLASQMGEGGVFSEGEIAIDAANANLGILVATFAAAVEAAGGLGGAIALLPESFDLLLQKFRELLGEENAALNQLTAYFNFAKENSEVLAAIDGLIAGMGQLAAMGLLNATNINMFADSARIQFEELLASTENQSMALIAMGPQIGELLGMYEKMGLEAPEWLKSIAEEALAAGASLEPPEGIEDILGSIRDILFEIAGAFGIAADAAGKFNTAAGGAKAPKGGPKPSKGGIPTTGAAKGFNGTVTGPQLFLVESGITEDVNIGPAGSGGGGGVTVNLQIDATGSLMDANQAAEMLAPAIEKVLEGDIRAIKTRFIDA